jgi:hypothetical protein
MDVEHFSRHVRVEQVSSWVGIEMSGHELFLHGCCHEIEFILFLKLHS